MCVLKINIKQGHCKTKTGKRNPNNFPQPHVDHVNDSTAGADCSGKDSGEQVEVQCILLCC